MKDDTNKQSVEDKTIIEISTTKLEELGEKMMDSLESFDPLMVGVAFNELWGALIQGVQE